MKKYLKILLFLFVIFGIQTVSRAETVSTSLSVPYKETDNWQQFNGLGTKNMYANSRSGYIDINLYKVFNFLKNDGSILTLNSTLDVGKKINTYVSNTEGNYSVNSKSFNINQGAVFTGENCFMLSCYYWKRVMEVFNPVESDGIKITSTNPSVVECVNNICTSKSPGVANIVVDFSKKTQTGVTSGVISVYETKRQMGVYTGTTENLWGVSGWTGYYDVQTYGNTYYGSDYGYGNILIGGWGFKTTIHDPVSTNNLKNATYSFPSITYTVTVPGTPNTPQVSTCTGAENITKDSATVKWSYTDVDNDPQTQYQVQLSTKSFNDSTFTNADIVFAGSGTGTITSHTFIGLTSNTTYYARIKTQNAVNGWSTVYSTCNAGFKTLTGDSSQPTCSCDNNRDYVCKQENGTVTSKTENDSQCNFASYCSVATTTTTTTFTFGPTGYRIGDVKYEHSGISVDRPSSNPVYTHQIPIQVGEQKLTVTLTDLGDGTKLPARTCSVTNGPITPTSPCGDSYTENQTTCPVDTELKWNCDTNTKTWKSTLTGNSCTPTTTTTKITITKTPKITLNKGGTCTLNWSITPTRPDGMTCTLTGTDNTSKDLSGLSGTHKSGPLQQNTKYTIGCTGGTPPQSLSASVICRINPSVNEI